MLDFVFPRTKIAQKERTARKPQSQANFEYIKFLTEELKLERVKELYDELNQIIHPASMSVFYQLEASDLDGGDVRLVILDEAGAKQIAVWESDFGKTIRELIPFSLDTAFIALSMLHRFDLHPKIPELRRFEAFFKGLQKTVRDNLAK